MKGNKLFTTLIDKGDPEGQRVTVKPSKYLKKLHPEKVISELEAHIQTLKDKLIRSSKEDLDVPKNRKKIRKLGFELDVAKKYLAHFRKKYEAIS
jgi:predicted  nucleic acid-binding Zn-ribbon protein